MTEWLNPGSDEAIAKGCTCPVLDNAHGKGYHGIPGQWAVSALCLLHAPNPIYHQISAAEVMYEYEERQRLLDAINEGGRRKQEGIERVSAGEERQKWLAHARNLAKTIYKPDGLVSSDDLHHFLVTPSGVSQNIWGAIFAEDGWEFVGYVKSERPEAHGRVIRQWRWKGE